MRIDDFTAVGKLNMRSSGVGFMSAGSFNSLPSLRAGASDSNSICSLEDELWDAIFDDMEDGPESDAPGNCLSREVRGDSHLWGPFYFTDVYRNGEPTNSWQAACPYHRDPGDIGAGRCRKTLSWGGAFDLSKDEALRLLKEWCTQVLEIDIDSASTARCPRTSRTSPALCIRR